MEVFSAILGIIIAAAAGFYMGRQTSTDSQEKSRLETELAQKTDELTAFQNKVTNHFEKTANLFNQVSDSYQSLYDHMAHSSSQLCSSTSFHSLPKSDVQQSTEQVRANLQTQTEASIPTKTNHLFNPDKLYNAHDYRNQDELTETPVSQSEDVPVNDNKVVDIETAKEDKNEAALDYAIKAEGVVNHNSLDMENVKTP
jgi:uncharacterized membrane-anchored protein YhcB (DUF1043 family)